jgi:hypothetical protein
VNSNWNSNQQIENREKEKELKQKKIRGLAYLATAQLSQPS